MKKIFLFLVFISLSFNSRAGTQGKMDIYACEAVWGSLAREIGGDKVNVFVLNDAKQDPHVIRKNDALIKSMRSADMIFCNGSDLEFSWLPMVLEKTGNFKIQYGAKAYFMAADYVSNRSGNPHIHLNPHNISQVADAFTKKISELDKVNASTYQNNYNDFIGRWEKSITFWEDKAQKLKGMPIITETDNFEYLISWLGLNKLAQMKGPTDLVVNDKKLQEVLDIIKANPPEALIYAPYEDKQIGLWLFQKTKVKSLQLPYTVYGEVNVNNLFDLFNITVYKLSQLNQPQK